MSDIHLRIDAAVAEIQLDNPRKLNALTLSMLQKLEDFCSTIEKRRDIRAVLLTAGGEKAFCVGADIAEWSSLSPLDFSRHWVRNGHRIFNRLAGLVQPTVAVLNGHTFGGGLELAVACDIRVMTPAATLGLPEANVGVVPGWSGTQRLQRLIPEGVLKEMMLFGRRLTAQRAFDLGLVAEVSADPLTTARQIALSASELSPVAVETAKYMIHAGAGEEQAALIEALASGMVAATADNTEGVTAFKEKRKARFLGQ